MHVSNLIATGLQSQSCSVGTQSLGARLEERQTLRGAHLWNGHEAVALQVSRPLGACQKPLRIKGSSFMRLGVRDYLGMRRAPT